MSYKSRNKRDNCFYCERKFSFNIFGGFASEKFVIKTLDHIVPTSRGGVEDGINTVVCCHECNCLKGSLMINEFIEKVKNLISSGETFKSISKTLLDKVLIKAEELKLYVESKGDRLCKIKPSLSMFYMQK